jgi:hypothetical protein
LEEEPGLEVAGIGPGSAAAALSGTPPAAGTHGPRHHLPLQGDPATALGHVGHNGRRPGLGYSRGWRDRVPVLGMPGWPREETPVPSYAPCWSAAGQAARGDRRTGFPRRQDSRRADGRPCLARQPVMRAASRRSRRPRPEDKLPGPSTAEAAPAISPAAPMGRGRAIAAAVEREYRARPAPAASNGQATTSRLPGCRVPDRD